MSLPALLAAATPDDTSLVARIEPQWLQGRTAYGGLSVALAYAAARRIADDLPPLRSVQVAFVGPLADLVSADPVLLRRGKNSAFIGCDVGGEAGLGLRAMFLFAASRPSALAWSDLAPPPQYDRMKGDVRGVAQNIPSFIANFEVFDSGDAPRHGFRRWMRLRERDGLDPVLEVIAIADALPPAAVALAREFGPLSTMTWQLNFVTDAPTTDDGCWLVESLTLDVGAGISSQAMTIWNRAGEAVATATQSVALFF